MKRLFALVITMFLLVLLVASSGCGGPKNDDADRGGDKGGTSDGVTKTGYDAGLADGYAQGYGRGYADGKKSIDNPVVSVPAGANEDYATGYEEGWLDGYADGHEEAVAEIGGEDKEMAEVKAAMLDFVKQNSAPGLQFTIEKIVIKDGEAAGRAVCTSETLESPYVIMEKGPGGWYGLEFGTGIEPPAWYPY